MLDEEDPDDEALDAEDELDELEDDELVELAQLPLWHWSSIVHVMPLASFGTHAPMSHQSVAAHCASPVQLVSHFPPTHA